MCVLAVGVGVFRRFPIVVVANRDEYYDRPSGPPQLLLAAPRVFGGCDHRGGGTWLGINEHSLIAALTNRYSRVPENPGLPSRGQLCLKALSARSATAAIGLAAASAAEAEYNGFNLIVADRVSTWILTNVGGLVPRSLEAGWHVVANGGLDDPLDPRVMRAKQRLTHVNRVPITNLPAWLCRLCRDHGSGAPGSCGADALCAHHAETGTRSSSVLLLKGEGGADFWHADGPPCQLDHRSLALPWQP